MDDDEYYQDDDYSRDDFYQGSQELQGEERFWFIVVIIALLGGAFEGLFL